MRFVIRSLRSPLRYAISFAGVGIAVLLLRQIPRASPTTVALTLLIVVLFVAASWGLRVAVVSALLATLAFNFFFLPPVGTLTIADTQNWVSLFAFLTTAVVASQLSERARRDAADAQRRRLEVERLYGFSQQLLIQDDPRALLKEVPREIAVTFGATSAALYLLSRDKMYRYGDAHAIPADAMKECARRSEPTCDSKFLVAPLRLGLKSVGAVGFAGNEMSSGSLEALGSLISAAVERINAIDSLAHAEAARESERLRTALLDSVTHDLRTPLTSIKASVSTLRSNAQIKPDDHDDLLAVIEEEADRLNRLVGEAVEMTQLDERRVQLHSEPNDISLSVQAAVAEVPLIREQHPIEVRVPPSLPKAIFDPEWVRKVLRHLIENAAKYSELGSPIFISAEVKGDNILTSVADRGSGIDDLERSMIFDKFYRGQSQRFRTQGTGMGLAIVRAIVEAHGGTIDVASQLGSGSVFTFSLPIARATAAQANVSP
jgi:two-component system sensor histidine kinase KdpD